MIIDFIIISLRWNFNVLLDLRNAGNNLSFNSAFVVSSFYPEKSFISPIFVPWVGNKPIWCSIFNTPTNDFNGMSSQSWSGFMLINTWFICQEILINGKCGFNWTVSHDFSLNFFNIWWNWIDWWGDPFILSISLSIDAVFFAWWGWFAGTTWFIFSGGVMIAWGESIRLAPILIVVKPSSDDTGSLPVSPSSWRISSIASIAASDTAAC